MIQVWRGWTLTWAVFVHVLRMHSSLIWDEFVTSFFFLNTTSFTGNLIQLFHFQPSFNSLSQVWVFLWPCVCRVSFSSSERCIAGWQISFLQLLIWPRWVMADTCLSHAEQLTWKLMFHISDHLSLLHCWEAAEVRRGNARMSVYVCVCVCVCLSVCLSVCVSVCLSTFEC